MAVLDRFDELIGLDRLALVHLNDSRSELGSAQRPARAPRRRDRSARSGSARCLRDPRLARGTAFIMETPGVDEGWDAVNMRRAWLLWGGATEPAGAAAEGLPHQTALDAQRHRPRHRPAARGERA